MQKLIRRRQQHFRKYRLYFEILFAARNNSHGSVLLGANAVPELESLAADLVHPERVCAEAAKNCTAFPEACSVSVEMRVTINKIPRFINWGSTLSSLVPASQNHVSLQRLYEGRLIPVEVDVADAAARKLPLLPDDHIDWR